MLAALVISTENVSFRARGCRLTQSSSLANMTISHDSRQLQHARAQRHSRFAQFVHVDREAQPGVLHEELDHAAVGYEALIVADGQHSPGNREWSPFGKTLRIGSSEKQELAVRPSLIRSEARGNQRVATGP